MTAKEQGCIPRMSLCGGAGGDTEGCSGEGAHSGPHGARNNVLEGFSSDRHCPGSLQVGEDKDAKQERIRAKWSPRGHGGLSVLTVPPGESGALFGVEPTLAQELEKPKGDPGS